MSPLARWIEANQLTAWREVQTDPTWAFLAATTNNIFDLIDIVDAAGWQTVQEAAAAVGPLAPLAPLVALKPAPVPAVLSFDRDDLDTVSWRSISTAFNQALKQPSDAAMKWSAVAMINNVDSNYGILSFDQIEEIAAKTPTSSMKYQPEVFDCDDFTEVMLAWLAEQGLGNTSIGAVQFSAYADNKPIDAHMALLAMDDQSRFWWVEPQNGEIYPLADSYIFPSADTLYITGLFF